MDKFEYILAQFHRTWNKKRENYCIERIITRINNPNLQFVTQQMFRRGEKRIALADLYFPQLQLSVEIDEEYHKSTEEKDLARTEDVIGAMKRLETVVPFAPEELRIKAGFEQTLESINAQIDDIVAMILHRIEVLPELHWDTVQLTPEEYIQQGRITADENASFRTIWDVSKLFSKGYKERCQRSWFDAQSDESSIKVWCPKVKIEGYDLRIPYDNEITVDCNYIYESAKENNDAFVNEYISSLKSKEIRYVFPRYRTQSGEYFYVFKGVYQLDIEESKIRNKRAWKRVSEELDIAVFHDEI